MAASVWLEGRNPEHVAVVRKLLEGHGWKVNWSRITRNVDGGVMSVRYLFELVEKNATIEVKDEGGSK